MMDGKQRMLNAYRGVFSDRIPIAPELWYYYPAKLMGVDMLAFQREVPFHQALKNAFAHFDCEGWGIAFGDSLAPDVKRTVKETWRNPDTLEVCTTLHAPSGDIEQREVYARHEPSWLTERYIKDPARDLDVFLHACMADPEKMDVSPFTRAWEEIGDAYLLEAWLGVPFFDFYGGNREGGLEAAVMDFFVQEPLFEGLQERYTDYMVRLARTICERTPFESLCIGCSWSCNSLIGPEMWRRWDKPVIAAVAQEAHRHGRLLHIHFHGRCIETVADFAEMGIDCVCPFERPPGGDVVGLDGLRQVVRLLDGHTTMNGNIHTVETLIRGTEGDVRREVREVMEAFKGNPRVILGTGDQVGYETPEENIYALIDEARRLSPEWRGAGS